MGCGYLKRRRQPAEFIVVIIVARWDEIARPGPRPLVRAGTGYLIVVIIIFILLLWEGAQAFVVFIHALDLGAQHRTGALADLAGNAGHVVVVAQVELAAVASQHIECCLSSCLGRSIENPLPRLKSRQHKSVAASASWGNGWLSGLFGGVLGSRNFVSYFDEGVILDNGRICTPAGFDLSPSLNLATMLSLLLLLLNPLVLYGAKRVVFSKGGRIYTPAGLNLGLIMAVA